MWKRNNDRCEFIVNQLPKNNHNFLLNTILQYVGMIWIIENNENLKYDMDIQNSDCMTGGPWYDTPICKKLHGK